ncbi:predicted protein [Chaetoceros tenuissimus]|uniref:Uncharacterized protein n=1 Tax=Chaetoceros tenuissimus TaxID=426638 RepID=A0AAD3H1G6_9STRA|nr:predicted protein [Chaetoceros tenuissimus]
MPKTSHKFKKGDRVFISSTETFATIQDATPNKDGRILVQMYILPSQMSAVKNGSKRQSYRFSDENNSEGSANASCVSENGEESKTRLAASNEEDDEPSDLPGLSAPVKDNTSAEEDEEEEEYQAGDEESENEDDINTQVGRILEKETDMLSIDEKSLQDSEYYSEEDDDKLGTQPLNEEELLGNDSYSQSSESEEEKVPKLDHSLRKKDKINYEESDEDYQSETDDNDLVEYTPSKTPGSKKYNTKNAKSTGRKKRGRKTTKSPKSRKRGKKNTRSSDSYDVIQERPNYAESDEDYQSETDEDDIVYLNHVRRKQIRAKVKEGESSGRKTRRNSSGDDDYESEDDF